MNLTVVFLFENTLSVYLMVMVVISSISSIFAVKQRKNGGN